MRRRAVLLALPAFAGSVLAARAAHAVSPPEHYELHRRIQGTWVAGGEAPGAPGRRPHSAYMEWTFDRGRFRHSGYPPITAEGTYRILAKDGDTLRLALSDEKSNFAGAAAPRRLDIEVRRQGEDSTLVIAGMTYKRKWIEKRD